MTPSRPAEVLHDLAGALIRLDPAAVESSCSRLEALALELRCQRVILAGAQRTEVLSALRFCAALARHAHQLYAGWLQAGRPPSIAYTPTGAEPTLAIPHRFLVKG